MKYFLLFFFLIFLNIAHADNQIDKGSPACAVDRVSHVILYDGSHSVCIQDDKMAFYTGQFFLYEHVLKPVCPPEDIEMEQVLHAKLYFDDSEVIQYDVLKDAAGRFYLRKGTSLFALSSEKYYMLSHLLHGYHAPLPESVEIPLPDRSHPLIRVTERDYLYIKKEEIDNETYYSAHLLFNYLRRGLTYYVCISGKYKSLLELLNEDKNLQTVRSVATWQYPPYYAYRKEFTNSTKLTAQEESCIIDYVISNGLNINQSWFLMGAFYSHVKTSDKSM